MFLPLHLLPLQYRQTIANQIVKWCENEKKLIYSSIGRGNPSADASANKSDRIAGLIERSFSEEELAIFKVNLQEILGVTNKISRFGGIVLGQQLSEINSLAIFSLDSTHQEASLTLFIANADANLQLETNPYQSSLLLLPIAALLRQEKTIEKLYLPFHKIELEDFLSLAVYQFAPDSSHGPGWWRQANTQVVLAELLLYPINQILDGKWIEVKLEVAPALVDYISRLFSRYSYQQRILIEQPNEGAVSAPAVLRGYLPVGIEAERRIEELSQKLASLGYLYPVAPLQFVERDLGYWQKLWEVPNLFRINAGLLLTPDRKDYIAAAGEILVEIPASSEVFASNEDGPHPTTALCLQLLAKYLNPQLHSNLLDLGTGGGTLAIVASFLGAKKILALDAFPPAIEVARANIRHNGVTNQVTVESGSLGVLVKKDSLIYSFPALAQQIPASLIARTPFDMIMSNTFYHVLIGHAQNLYRVLRPGGTLISGGILKQHTQAVANAFQIVGFELIDQAEDENWISFVHYRPC